LYAAFDFFGKVTTSSDIVRLYGSSVFLFFVLLRTSMLIP
jgi:hypothetical protein